MLSWMVQQRSNLGMPSLYTGALKALSRLKTFSQLRPKDDRNIVYIGALLSPSMQACDIHESDLGENSGAVKHMSTQEALAHKVSRQGPVNSGDQDGYMK